MENSNEDNDEEMEFSGDELEEYEQLVFGTDTEYGSEDEEEEEEEDKDDEVVEPRTRKRGKTSKQSQQTQQSNLQCTGMSIF